MKQFKGVAGVGVILNIITESSQIFNNTRLRARKFLWCKSKILSTFVVCEGHDQVTDSHLLDVRRSIEQGTIVQLLVGQCSYPAGYKNEGQAVLQVAI